MRTRTLTSIAALWIALPAFGTVFGVIRGVVHDPDHRPVPGAEVTLEARNSHYIETVRTNGGGEFEFRAVPVGEYLLRIAQPGFAESEQPVIVVSGVSRVLHLQLRLAQQSDSVRVSESAEAVNPESSTPSTLVTRFDIQHTPGAGLSNSLAMITDYVPGAYITHDQLHVRGGHQVTWAIDGIPIPNTNIANSVGPQIDPKDIDYLEAQRGGYSSEYGDRTYAVFNVVPRTGFERSRDLELNTTYGTFHQTNDYLSFGDHTQRFAWFGSVNGNRSDYGLQTPGPEVLHDRATGLGGFGSVIFNHDANNQLRLVASARRDVYQIPNDPDAQFSGVRDVERERDALADFTWLHSFSPELLLTLSPFVHSSRTGYEGGPNGVPVSAVQRLDSMYAGAQVAVSAATASHNARVGVYGFAQHDREFIHLQDNGAPGAGVLEDKASAGRLEAAFAEDRVKVASWLTATAGLRFTRFSGAISENAVSPRIGAAVRIPHLNWVVRAFLGRYYQAPPLSTVSGPILQYAVAQGLGVIPLRGERDREDQAGLTIPLRGWTLDANAFRLRASNYFDHNAIGNSNVFLPLTIAGARISGLEFTARSPRVFQRLDLAVAYSHQRAEGRGPVTGGLTDFSPPPPGCFLLDHDQRHTLHANFNASLPFRTWAAGGLYYGSGFTDGASEVPKHLDPHTTFDLSIGKTLHEDLSISVTALNLTNRRFLLDNSATFGGTHYADPRQIYIQLRYKFHL